jgi:hypothetical protein
MRQRKLIQRVNKATLTLSLNHTPPYMPAFYVRPTGISVTTLMHVGGHLPLGTRTRKKVPADKAQILECQWLWPSILKQVN